MALNVTAFVIHGHLDWHHPKAHGLALVIAGMSPPAITRLPT